MVEYQMDAKKCFCGSILPGRDDEISVGEDVGSFMWRKGGTAARRRSSTYCGIPHLPFALESYVPFLKPVLPVVTCTPAKWESQKRRDKSTRGGSVEPRIVPSW